MSRLSLKSLLFENLDSLYQEIIEKSFQHSKLSKTEFDLYYASQKERIDETFTKEILKAYKQSYTHRTDFYLKGILTQEKAMFNTYRKPFRLYFSYLSTGHFLLKNASDQIAGLNHTSTDTICLSLFAQLLRIGDQVGVMLLNGYEDAALVIWRSYYEYALILKLLAEAEDDDLCTGFMDHNNLNSKKLMVSYNKRLLSEGFDPIDEQTQKELTAAEAEFKKKYGNEFLSEYGWVNKKLGHKRTTLRDLENFLNMSRYRPFYIWASAHAHGTFEAFRKVSEDNKIIVSRITEVSTDAQSLVDPMQLTLAVMQDVVRPLLNLIAHPGEVQLDIDLFDSLYNQFIRQIGKIASD